MASPCRTLVMLRRRSEFLRIRNGLRLPTAAFVVEARSREGWTSPAPIDADIPRFGLTVTKQMGGAVVRNRIRRRLKAALREIGPDNATSGFDYVVIAREPALSMPFDRLCADLAAAITGVHSRRPSTRPARRGPRGKSSSP